MSLIQSKSGRKFSHLSLFDRNLIFLTYIRLIYLYTVCMLPYRNAFAVFSKLTDNVKSLVYSKMVKSIITEIQRCEMYQQLFQLFFLNNLLFGMQLFISFFMPFQTNIFTSAQCCTKKCRVQIFGISSCSFLDFLSKI